MRCLTLALILILLAGVMHAWAAVQITEFCPDPWMYQDADEYIVLSGTGPLDTITVSDGHGGFRFPAGTTINGSLTIARNGLAFRESHGVFPDFEWTGDSPEVPGVVGGDPLRLANAGDCLMLHDGIRLTQEICWPQEVKPREGEVHYLEDGVWDKRPLMLGQSRFHAAVFRNVTVTTFVSPDCSNEVFSEAMAKAKESIRLNMYEFSSPAMGDALIAARARGANITVLLEGGPVGGMSDSEKDLVLTLNRSGIPVLSMVSSGTTHAPYRYDHAKYAVIDGSELLITSENFKYSGFPPEGMSGNRGWGVLCDDRGLAGYFSKVFSADTSGPSSVPYSGVSGEPENAAGDTHTVKFRPARFEGATVTPVIAPDTSSLITDLLDSSQQSIEIEQAYIKNETKGGLNRYLAAAINASRRGVHVRVLLDSYWFNVEGPNDNDEMAALINRIATAEHLPLEAKCINLAVSQVDKIHNKGVIVDDRRVLVSSINWNTNSPDFNREAGVIIDHPGAAAYFRAVFDDDWAPQYHTPSQGTDRIKIIVALVVIVLLGIFYFMRRR